MNLSAPRRPGGVPADVPGLLRALLDDDPGRPRLTWYGPDGERVELSAKVLDNWVAKTANLLVDELDAGPGSRIAIALPPHWRTATWLLAIWSTGACAVVHPAPASAPGAVPEAVPEAVPGIAPRPVDVLVSDDTTVLENAPDGTIPVAVALPALATWFGADLPRGAVDAALDVRSFGDVFVTFAHPTPDDPALTWASRSGTPGDPATGDPVSGDPVSGVVTHGELIPAAVRAADAAGLPPRVRLLAGGGAEAAVAELLAPLVRLGSVVLHHDPVGTDPAVLAALRAQEGITPTTPPRSTGPRAGRGSAPGPGLPPR